MHPPIRRSASPLLLALGALVSLAAGCSSAPNAASAVDYRKGVAVIAIEEFHDESKVKEEQTVFYNMKTEEGRRMAAQAKSQERPGRFTLAVAHNVALRLKDAGEAMRAAGLTVPVVIAITSVYPEGIVATGAGAFGTAFERPPADLPRPSVRVRGAIRYDVQRSLFTELIQGTDLGKLYPYDRFEAAAEMTIEQNGEEQRHLLAFLSKPDARNLGLPGYDEDPGAQLVARVSDYLAPTRIRVKGAPIGFVRRVVDERTLEVDLGLERHIVHVTKVNDLEQPLADPPTREDLDRALGRQYVRIRWQGQDEPPARGTIWKRIEVSEGAPE